MAIRFDSHEVGDDYGKYSKKLISWGDFREESCFVIVNDVLARSFKIWDNQTNKVM